MTPPTIDLRQLLIQQLSSQSVDHVAITMIEQDRYGRWVGEVWVNPGPANEKIAKGLLVLRGLAKIYPDNLSQCPNTQADVMPQQTALVS